VRIWWFGGGGVGGEMQIARELLLLLFGYEIKRVSEKKNKNKREKNAMKLAVTKECEMMDFLNQRHGCGCGCGVELMRGEREREIKGSRDKLHFVSVHEFNAI
jgi:hypothetical protein